MIEMKNMVRKILVALIWPILYSIININLAYAITSAEAEVLIFKYISMALSVGLSCIGAGWALSRAGPASAAAVAEKPELFGRTMVYVGMAEGIAIYGILIAFLIWIG
ncbi:MAG: ATP synthase subunit C [Candidatus Bathyarchaeota archaeon]|nr:ATP synthase subunit C [Candidatus Bathyarchaeota archaeon]